MGIKIINERSFIIHSNLKRLSGLVVLNEGMKGPYSKSHI
jgi:hypothetical protein